MLLLFCSLLLKHAMTVVVGEVVGPCSFFIGDIDEDVEEEAAEVIFEFEGCFDVVAVGAAEVQAHLAAGPLLQQQQQQLPARPMERSRCFSTSQSLLPQQPVQQRPLARPMVRSRCFSSLQNIVSTMLSQVLGVRTETPRSRRRDCSRCRLPPQTCFPLPRSSLTWRCAQVLGVRTKTPRSRRCRQLARRAPCLSSTCSMRSSQVLGVRTETPPSRAQSLLSPWATPARCCVAGARSF